MKKEKQSKKRWAWTEAQKRKHFSARCWNDKTPPSWYCNVYNRKNRNKSKRTLYKVINGWDIDYLDFSPQYHHRCAGWFWW